jgi:hypothetical protein
MSNMMFLIERKREYMCILKDVLENPILTGLQEIYNSCKSTNSDNQVIIAFQKSLREIQGWSDEKKSQKCESIDTATSNCKYLGKLLQEIFRINIKLFGLKDTDRSCTFKSFIHLVYIECAREMWKNPFLFYHGYSPYEQNRNNMTIREKICIAIENAIRRALPIDKILDERIKNAFKGEHPIDYTCLADVELIVDRTEGDEGIGNGEFIGGAMQTFSPAQMNQIESIFNQAISSMKTQQNTPQQVAQNASQNASQNFPQNVPQNAQQNASQQVQQNMQQVQQNMQQVQQNMQQQVALQYQNKVQNQQHQNDSIVNNEILNIINKNKVLSDSNEKEMNHFTVNNHSAVMPMMKKSHSDKRSSSTIRRIVNESLRQSHNTGTKSHSGNSEIKNKVLKDLDTESLTYNPEANDKNYQDIFSNSEVKNTINTNEKVEKKSRDKFFNAYLNI